MKKNKFLEVLCGLALMTSFAHASTFDPCSGAAVNNVAATVGVGSDNTVTCDGSPFTFSNFAVSVTGGTAQLNIAGVGFSGYSNGVVSLAFQIGSVTGTISDILLFYQVNGPLGAVDLSNGGTNVNIQEQVFDTCTAPLYSGGCSNLLVTLIVNAGDPPKTSNSFVSADGVTFIKKDIQYGGQGAFISDFTNSQHVVPEPMTLSLMGFGLLGLGLLRRRQVKK